MIGSLGIFTKYFAPVRTSYSNSGLDTVLLVKFSALLEQVANLFTLIYHQKIDSQDNEVQKWNFLFSHVPVGPPSSYSGGSFSILTA